MDLNGCGSYNIIADNYISFFGLSSLIGCCLDHDACYQNCKSSKKICDDEFNKCLKEECNQLASRKNSSFFQKNCNIVQK